MKSIIEVVLSRNQQQRYPKNMLFRWVKLYYCKQKYFALTTFWYFSCSELTPFSVIYKYPKKRTIPLLSWNVILRNRVCCYNMVHHSGIWLVQLLLLIIIGVAVVNIVVVAAIAVIWMNLSFIFKFIFIFEFGVFGTFATEASYLQNLTFLYKRCNFVNTTFQDIEDGKFELKSWEIIIEVDNNNSISLFPSLLHTFFLSSFFESFFFKTSCRHRSNLFILIKKHSAKYFILFILNWQIYNFREKMKSLIAKMWRKLLQTVI